MSVIAQPGQHSVTVEGRRHVAAAVPVSLRRVEAGAARAAGIAPRAPRARVSVELNHWQQEEADALAEAQRRREERNERAIARLMQENVCKERATGHGAKGAHEDNRSVQPVTVTRGRKGRSA